TAERMRAAVEQAFGPLEEVESGGRRRHWRLSSDRLRGLVSVSADELGALSTAAAALERAGLAERAAKLEAVADKLRALHRSRTPEQLEADLETLLRAEGLAMRPGPRQPVDTDLLALLRDAIRASRTVEFDYLSRQTGLQSRQTVEPYGLLYGNRPFLVARTDWSGEPRLWRLANVSGARLGLEDFRRDPDFDLRRFARRSFGTYQETPVKAVLRFDARAAPDAATFLFHPEQDAVTNEDGTVTVRFEAGGLDEMCWHLVTWGDSVTVEQPERLRQKLAEMCEALAVHHGKRDVRATD
ncbi:MAG: WYL domain-containing protein, partial [Alphaproteobacteria bacterium]|nr:WYL domain-containing protein [Alphaproteobacteria bacterium]